MTNNNEPNNGGIDGDGIDELLERNIPQPQEFQFNFDWKPKEIKAKLDEYIIGQEDAKKILANTACYHYARVKRAMETPEGNNPSMKKNVIMIGPTGVGKTYMVTKLAELLGVPWTKQDATRFSSTGYVGKDVDDIIRDLYIKAGKNIEAAQYGIVMIDEIDKIRAVPGYGKDVNGVEVQQCLLKLMEDTDVDLVSADDPLVARMAMMMREDERQGQKPVINTKHILFIVSGCFPQLKETVARRLEKIDDALGDRWYNEILPQDIVRLGFETEFIGRLPVRAGFHELNNNHLYQILRESKESIMNQYVEDLKVYGITLKVEDDALKLIANKASEQKTGARGLVSVIERVMQDFLFELPSTEIKEFTITGEMVSDPEQAYTQFLSDYNQKKDYYAFNGVVDKYKKEHGIDLGFTEGSRAKIIDLAKRTNATIGNVCDDLLKKFAVAMNLFEKNKLEVNEELVDNPSKYLQQLTKKYAMSK